MASLWQTVRGWLGGPTKDSRDVLASLLLAAQDDPAFRAQLVFVLRLPRAQREPLIATALEQMALRGEPVMARSAFRVLSTEDGARRALQALGEPN